MNAFDILAEALEIEDELTRSEYVKRTCNGDSQLLHRVEAMLQFHEADHDFLRADSFDHVLIEERIGEGIGTQIDCYKLLELIGEGGFGTVYLAQQSTPVCRRVALKIIKLGMDTRQFVARFEAERQALAMMDHPNIAKVFDAGATEAGRPYFVMELVNGDSITTFCDSNKLSVRQRLQLFVQVCRAVQHAHQKGIIHRDLKPSNVLVTLKGEQPIPKVIDFGVAKSIDQRLTERTLFTHFGQMVGTPEYMSPEQAQKSDFNVDTRSDVYSLGVLLFEILVGEPPVSAEKLREAGYDQMRQIIAEEFQETPSARFTSQMHKQTAKLADLRSVEQSKLLSQLRGDLDWITMKCLEKDMEQRYASAQELASDVLLHLDGQPVLAGPPSTLYKVQKLIKRNRAAVMSIATILLITTTAAMSSLYSLLQSNRALRSYEATMSLWDDFISRIDPTGRSSAEYSALEMFDDFAEGIPDLSDQPDVEMRLRSFLGMAYEKLGNAEKSYEQLVRAAEIQQGEGNTAEAAALLFAAGRVGADTPTADNIDRTIECLNQAADLCTPDQKELMVEILKTKALAEIQVNQIDVAENDIAKARQVLETNGVVAHDHLKDSYVWLELARGGPNAALKLLKDEPQGSLARLRCFCLMAMATPEAAAEAEAMLQKRLLAFDRPKGTYSLNEGRVIAQIGDCQKMQGRHHDAAALLESHFESVTDITKAWLLPDWAVAQLDVGKIDLVDKRCQVLVDRLPSKSGALRSKVTTRLVRAVVLHEQNSTEVGQFADASEADYEQALEEWPNDFGMQTMVAWNLMNREGDLKRAEQLAEQAVSGIKRLLPFFANGYRGALPFHVLARAKAEKGEVNEAIRIEEEALDRLPGHFPYLKGYFERCLAEYRSKSDE